MLFGMQFRSCSSAVFVSLLLSLPIVTAVPASGGQVSPLEARQAQERWTVYAYSGRGCTGNKGFYGHWDAIDCKVVGAWHDSDEVNSFYWKPPALCPQPFEFSYYPAEDCSGHGASMATTEAEGCIDIRANLAHSGVHAFKVERKDVVSLSLCAGDDTLTHIKLLRAGFASDLDPFEWSLGDPTARTLGIESTRCWAFLPRVTRRPLMHPSIRRVSG